MPGPSGVVPDYRYFFYLTNDRWLVGGGSRVRGQRSLRSREPAAQLKGSVRALHAPVDNLVSNWAYMVMTSLAWNLKAWWALCACPRGAGHRASRRSRGKAAGVADGVQDVPQRRGAVALSDRADRPAFDLPLVELEPLAAGAVPLARSASLLNQSSLKPESGCSGPPPRPATESNRPCPTTTRTEPRACRHRTPLLRPASRRKGRQAGSSYACLRTRHTVGRPTECATRRTSFNGNALPLMFKHTHQVQPAN